MKIYIRPFSQFDYSCLCTIEQQSSLSSFIWFYKGARKNVIHFDIMIRLIFDIRIRFIFGLDVELSVISGYVRNCAPTLETLEIINPDCWLDPHILTQCKVLKESLTDYKIGFIIFFFRLYYKHKISLPMSRYSTKVNLNFYDIKENHVKREAFTPFLMCLFFSFLLCLGLCV